ncbi:two-component sensor histidine kinase [Paenibacillus sambharensis]|uniref:Two-component sensor histidine kinase n=1 Tax=Paenibacillus sambharensis TaxID=1803190 RepID=A0A2W1M1R7_9BACL|nr:histidine kinase [Paenibacillus sambharensis]PZD97597.1 two-component sensor histidine kinase [Paenibacillus sambharensis]
MGAVGKWIRSRVQSAGERLSRRLVNKLVLLFTSIITLVVISLTVISYQMLQRESVEHSIIGTTNTLKLVNQNLEDFISGVEQLSLPQIRYDQIVSSIENEQHDYAARLYLESYLRELYYSRTDMEVICFYLVEQQKYYYITRENYNLRVLTAEGDEITRQSWFRAMIDQGGSREFQSFFEGENEIGYEINIKNSFMAYHRVLRSIPTREPQALISFYLNSSVLDGMLADVPLGKGEQLLFLDKDNRLFYAADMDYYNRIKQAGLLDGITGDSAGRLTWRDGEERYLVMYDVGSQSGWKLVKPIPHKELYAAATATRDWSILIGLGFIVLSIILVTYTSNAITQPLKRLSQQMSRFSTGSFDAEAAVTGRDEIAYLTRHFNQMVRNTNELINERYKMKLSEKNAILKALEAEINPHFLYNALQAISTKALRHERFDIADMVDALAQTLRYCISGRDVVQARDELKHIERYLSLQKARFGTRLQVTTDWDEALMGLELPKLSVQTLAENAVKHALEKVSTTVNIAIKARLYSGKAVISVRDNGPGIPPARLDEVLRSLASGWEEREIGESIGLTNLSTRLKLLYGEEAGLEIRTGEDGTEMSMIIPQGGGSHV